MANPQFNVVAAGRLLEGFRADQVIVQLQQQLKLPAAQAQQLLAGKPVVVKKSVPHDIAQAYCRRLLALGVQTRVESLSAPAAAKAPASAAPAPAPARTAAVAQRRAAPVAKPTAAAVRYCNAAPPPAKARLSLPYMTALARAGTSTGLLVAGYALATLLLVVLTLYYTIHFAYLLVAPPVLFSATVYLLPLLVLLLVSALLLRPFIARVLKTEPTPVTPLPVSPTTEPRLFHFIEELCGALGTPMPQEIHIDTGGGAAVALKPGLRNFQSGIYVLTIGLPPLQLLSLRQCGGLLARTLGQAAKPATLRCITVLDDIAATLQNCIDGRDPYGAVLQRFSAREQKPALALAVQAARTCLNLSTQLLRRVAAQAATLRAPLQQAALLEADRYQALVAGSQNFADTLVVFAKLENAGNAATAKNLEDRSEGGLIDNLPALVRHYYDSFDEKFERDLRREWEAQALRSDGSQVGVKDRIERILAAGEAGIIGSTDSAATLLQTLPALENQATRLLYKKLNLPWEESTLLPVHALLHAATEELLQRQQAESYFNGWFRASLFWNLPDYKLIREMPQGDAVPQLNVCVAEIRRLSPDRYKLLAEFDKLQNQLQELLLGQQVIAVGQKYNFRYVQYDGTSLQPLLESRQHELAKVVEQLTLQDGIMGGRIALGLRLSGQTDRIVEALHNALLKLRGIDNRVYKFALDVQLLAQLHQRHYEQGEAKYTAAIARLEEKVGDAGTVLLERLKTMPCPFDERCATLYEYVEPAVRKHIPRASRTSSLQRAQALLQGIYGANEKLNLLAADYGTIAEESYRIKRIRLIREE